MACKHILLDVMPYLNNLLPKTIYFVDENGYEIVTDENGIPTFIGLRPQYPDANTPLADDDKFLVRQGSDWKEVDKSELGGGEKQQYIYDFGGIWYGKKDTFTHGAKYTYGVRGSLSNYVTVNNALEVLLAPTSKGYIITKDNIKVKSLSGYVLYGYNEPYNFYIGRKHYNNGDIEPEIIYEKENVLLPHNSRWFYDINSNIEFKVGDEIIFFIKYIGDNNTANLYNFFNQILME